MKFLEAVNLTSKFTETAIFEAEQSYFTNTEMSFFGRISSETPSDKSIGLYENISNFLRVASLFEEPDITINNETLLINETASSDLTGSANFVTSDIRLIRNLVTADIKSIIEQTLTPEPTMTARIDKNIIHKIKVASSAIPNSKVIVFSKDGNIEFIIKDVDVLMSSSNSYRFKIEGQSTKDCSVVLDASFFAKMPDEFDFSLVFSNKSSTFRAVLKDDDIVVVIPTSHTSV